MQKILALPTRLDSDFESTVTESPEMELIPDPEDRSWFLLVCGIILFVIAIPMQWFNERRTVRINSLVARGLEECRSVDSMKADKSNDGRLVHVQGKVCGVSSLVDPQFHDAVVRNCLKLQSTVEVFEWVPLDRATRENPLSQSHGQQYRTEWTTRHFDSMRFRKPSPENPRPPSSMSLGTSTQACARADLGAFQLAPGMVSKFHRYEPAMKHLPSSVTAHGLTFIANPEDGYYYCRVGAAPSPVPWANLFVEHQVGDMRARFMCVPACDATVVAVQCHKGGLPTFVPYRALARCPCTSEEQVRQGLIEEGDQPLKDIQGDVLCCMGGRFATCCCCVCNCISCCCAQEVVTEEIFYASDKLVGPDVPFHLVVGRSSWRVLFFRLLGWAVMFLGTSMILSPCSTRLQQVQGLQAYGGSVVLVVAAIATFASSSCLITGAYAMYRPIAGVKWIIAAGVVVGIPFLCSRVSYLLGKA